MADDKTTAILCCGGSSLCDRNRPKPDLYEPCPLGDRSCAVDIDGAHDPWCRGGNNGSSTDDMTPSTDDMTPTKE